MTAEDLMRESATKQSQLESEVGKVYYLHLDQSTARDNQGTTKDNNGR